METIIFLRSEHGNNYFIDTKSRVISLCHPLLSTKSTFQTSNVFSKDETSYYINKKEYLSKYKLFDNYLQNNYIRITPQDVEQGLLNTDQLLFEVTDACNLNCKYCGYGEFYDDYIPRNNINMPISYVNSILNYMRQLWESRQYLHNKKTIFIGFYGGEPLLNFSLIKLVVKIIKSWNNYERFVFTMTTNALLLTKHMDFLVENNFLLLISLDGNKKNSGYRLDKNGKSSFSRVLKNVDDLIHKYPDYFDKKVDFNAVLHNKNSVSEIYKFVKKRYGKVPRVAELNNMGIRPEKRSDFENIYKNISKNLEQAKNYDEICSNMFMNLPEYKSITRIIHFFSGFVYKTYNNLFNRKCEHYYFPTGTCLPFSKKIFITANGKLLPCERIGQQFSLGSIIKDKVEINYNEIADRYNIYFDKLNSQCSVCYNANICVQCIFNIKNLDNNPVCHGFMNQEVVSRYFSNNISFLENHPADYYRIMEEVIME